MIMSQIQEKVVCENPLTKGCPLNSNNVYIILAIAEANLSWISLLPVNTFIPDIDYRIAPMSCQVIFPLKISYFIRLINKYIN